MNNIKLGFIILIMGCFYSCKTTYYQLYTTEPFENMKKEKNAMNYEDDNCIIYYDFWCPYGNTNFIIYNKTNNNIYLNKEECFFILNGFAYNYYNNKSYSYSTSIGKSKEKGVTLFGGVNFENKEIGINHINNIQANSISVTQGVNKLINETVSTSTTERITYKEEKITIIPPKTSKIIQGYPITSELYKKCDLLLYNKSTKNKYLLFNKQNSPLIFGNKISYFLEDSPAKINVENNFYVSRISNYTEKELTEYEKIKDCQATTYKPKYEIKRFKEEFISSGSFYIPYQ